MYARNKTQVVGGKPKFVRYKEGAAMYSMGVTKFSALAHDAGAVYKIDKVALVNCEKFEKYLESFCLE